MTDSDASDARDLSGCEIRLGQAGVLGPVSGNCVRYTVLARDRHPWSGAKRDQIARGPPPRAPRDCSASSDKLVNHFMPPYVFHQVLILKRVKGEQTSKLLPPTPRCDEKCTQIADSETVRWQSSCQRVRKFLILKKLTGYIMNAGTDNEA